MPRWKYDPGEHRIKHFKVSKQLAVYQLHNSGCALAPQDELALTVQLRQYDAVSPVVLGNH